ncbi:MAG: hypothetical protein ACFFER_13190, partial [Candidatus Thorarchaeota archaeon]
MAISGQTLGGDWEIVSFYAATDTHLVSFNLTSSPKDPMSIQNNTPFVNHTFSLICISQTTNLLYAAVLDQGIWSFNSSSEEFTAIPIEANFTQNQITCLEFRERYLLIGLENGFCIYDVLADSSVTPSTGPGVEATINTIEMEGSSIYLGTDQGVIIYDLETELEHAGTLGVANGLPDPRVYSLKANPFIDGILIGTDSGLCKFDDVTGTITESYELTKNLGRVHQIEVLQDSNIARIFLICGNSFYIFSIDYGLLYSGILPVIESIQENIVGITVSVVGAVASAMVLVVLRSERSEQKNVNLELLKLIREMREEPEVSVESENGTSD